MERRLRCEAGHCEVRAVAPSAWAVLTSARSVLSVFTSFGELVATMKEWSSRARGHRREGEQIVAEPAIADELDTTVNLAYRPQVIAVKRCRNADESRAVPPDRVGQTRSQPIVDQQVELSSVVVEPVKVEQTLANLIYREPALVLDHHRGFPVIDS